MARRKKNTGRKKGDKRIPELKWGEPKKAVSLLLTESAYELLGAIAADLSLTRSEALEQLIRAGIGISRGGFKPALQFLDSTLAGVGMGDPDYHFLQQLRGDVLQSLGRLNPPDPPTPPTP
jgi:hypothetical protein